jgi:hypothetical protein
MPSDSQRRGKGPRKGPFPPVLYLWPNQNGSVVSKR